MATLTSTVINRVLKRFRVRDNPDILAVAMTNSQTTLTYTGILPSWGPGTIAEIGSELVLVTEVDLVSKVATVVRGWLSTTAVAHSIGDPIFLDPRMQRNDILDLINDCLEDMFGHGLYTTDVMEIVYDPGTIGYDLDADATKILRVDGLKDAHALYWEPVHDWFEMDNTDLTDFPSGRAIMLRASLPLGVFRVVFSKPFTQVTTEADDLEVVAGIRPYMADLPFYFAMSRLMIDAETDRSQIEKAQNHQRAQDVPGFLALRTGEWYKARYEERIVTARGHLVKETKVVQTAGYGS